MKKMEHVSGREETERRRRQEGRAHNKEGVRKKGGLTEDGQKLRKEKKGIGFRKEGDRTEKVSGRKEKERRRCQEGRRQNGTSDRKEGDRTKKVSGRKDTE